MGFEFDVTQRMAEEAKDRGMSLSMLLEAEDPTSAYPPHEQVVNGIRMDAFRRQLAKSDIRVSSDLFNRIPAHKMERFFEPAEKLGGNDGAMLAIEWMNRTYKGASFAGDAQQPGIMWQRSLDKPKGNAGLFNPADGQRFPVDVPLNFTLFPPAIYDQLRFQQVQPSALQYLIARTRVIDSENFKALYLSNDNPGSTAFLGARLRRVEPFAEPQIWTFATGENVISVVKYANALRMSYEQMRRMEIDLVGWAISYIAQVADRDKEDSAVNIIINGDGNASSAATSYNGSTLDGAAGGAMTLKMWLAWRYKWTRPYTARVVIGAPADLIPLFLLSAGTANFAPQFYLQNNMTQAVNVMPVRTTLEGVLAVDNTTGAANTLTGIDSSAALEMVLENGSNIVQMDQVIRNQFNEIVFSENIGWDIAIRNQNKVLAYTA